MATRVLYRSLLREARRIQALEPHQSFALRDVLSPERWGSGDYIKSEAFEDKTILDRVIPGSVARALPATFQGGKLTHADVTAVIRTAFRPAPDSVPDQGTQLEAGFDGIRFIAHQLSLAEQTCTTTTNGVTVEVSAEDISRHPLVTRDGAGRGQEQFPEAVISYRVRLTNTGAGTVQLLGRHWFKAEGGGPRLEIVPKGSPGVVGHTPTLEPGQIFEYYSGMSIKASRAVLDGSFQMVGETGEEFDAAVGPCALVARSSTAQYS
jgi:ApaG protein